MPGILAGTVEDAVIASVTTLSETNICLFHCHCTT
uniref:Uncharacterized protein n=1 Tax=Arundo donax TaxID=35708 RepID=A0A0A9GVS3_ARUDO